MNEIIVIERPINWEMIIVMILLGVICLFPVIDYLKQVIGSFFKKKEESNGISKDA